MISENKNTISHGEEMRILLLEDSSHDSELIAHELQKAGISFYLTRVDTRESFIKELRQIRPDVIISDFSVPGFSGMDALRFVRSANYDTPFVLVTETQSEQFAVECMKEGLDDYILKNGLIRLPSTVLSVVAKKKYEREKKIAEEALRHSEERYRIVTETATDAILSFDSQGRILFANSAAGKIFGYKVDELLGRSITMLMPEHLRRLHKVSMKRYMETGIRHLNWNYSELIGLHKTGREFAVEVSFGESTRNGIHQFTGIIRDISERKQSEEYLKETNRQLRALSARLETVLEEERARIAREIHDELGQSLTALNMDIAWLEKRIPQSSTLITDKIRSIESMIQSTLHLVQHIASELRPAILDDLGFVAAAEWQTQDFERRTGLKCRFTSTSDDLNLSQPQSITLFRILQETLTNILRHAHASSIDVQIHQEADEILMRVKDDGKGFSEENIPRFQSLGILGMKERALLVGGKVFIAGKPGKGTTVSVRIPYRNGEHKQWRDYESK